MKKTILLLIFSLFSLSVKAQKEIETARVFLKENIEKQHLALTDINEMTVSSAYLSPSTGWYHVYFTQTYQAIEVYNSVLNVTLVNGQVQNANHTFVANLSSKAGLNNLTTKLNPINAIEKVALSKGLNLNNLGQTKELNTTNLANGNLVKGSYANTNLSDENVEVKQFWLPVEATENGKTFPKLALTWNVRFVTKDRKNSWNVHVDANSGEILQERDEVIHCSFGSPNHTNTPHIYQDEVLSESKNKIFAANSYNVFDIPLNSPLAGARTIVTSPFTRFVPATTGPGATNGWHDDGTTAFTNTRGNNVWAKEDVAHDNETTIGASPSSSTLDFNYPYSQTLASSAANQNAAITNLFYWNNVMHDVLYKYGFDEPSGNF